MPFIIGSTTPIIAFVAIAASTAFPPLSRIRTPACEASGDSDATIPPFATTIERAWVRSCPIAGATHVNSPAKAKNNDPFDVLFARVWFTVSPTDFGPSRSAYEFHRDTILVTQRAGKLSISRQTVYTGLGRHPTLFHCAALPNRRRIVVAFRKLQTDALAHGFSRKAASHGLGR